MKVTKTYQKYCTLCWDVYIICICNVLILSDYCVTIKNELPVTFASLGSEVAECSIFSRIIDLVTVNSAEWHLVNESYKFRIGAYNNWPSACNNWLRACNNWPSTWNDWLSA
jgi:hypothetical protein